VGEKKGGKKYGGYRLGATWETHGRWEKKGENGVLTQVSVKVLLHVGEEAWGVLMW